MIVPAGDSLLCVGVFFEYSILVDVDPDGSCIIVVF